LVRAKWEAELERGINLLDQAQTYLEQTELLVRGELIKKAAGIFARTSQDGENGIATLGLAWLVRCHQENGDPKAARKAYETVMREEGSQADSGRRLARSFLLRVIADDPVKHAAAEIRQAAEGWLHDYRAYLDTSEGCAVRFELARAYQELARRLYKQGPPPPAARQLYEEAQALFRSLEETAPEHALAAREHGLAIRLAVAEGRIRGDVSKLPDFDSCLLRAHSEAAGFDEAEKDPSDPKRDARRKNHLEAMTAALTRALDLAPASAPDEDLADARYLLARAYWHAGDYQRAAPLAEQVARSQKRSLRAPLAGACALLAYARLLAAGGRAETEAGALAPERDRLLELAHYLEQTWPGEAAADVARHQRGLLLWAEKKYAEAVEVFAQVSPEYADSTYTSYLLALAANKSHEAGAPPPPGKPPYQQRALAALESIPDLPADADPATGRVFLDARLTQGGMLYTAGQYARARALAAALTTLVDGPRLKLDNRARAEQQARVLALALLADYGQAEADYRAGRYGEARRLLDPIVARLEDPEHAARFAQLQDLRPVGFVLALALRVHVQEGRVGRAKEILELLRKTGPEDSLDALVNFVQQLRAQIQELRQQGEAARPRLEETIASFVAFLDELGKQPDRVHKPQTAFFLAQSYASLDRHDRAVALLEAIPEPQAGADPKDVQLYRAARLLCVRELRHNRQYDKAMEVLQGILGTRARPAWGQSVLEAQKERILLLQDQELFSGRGGAILAWNELMAQMRPKIAQDNKLKEQYFECYYQLTYCMFKNALKISDPGKRRSAIQTAANLVVQLEATQPDMGGNVPKQLFEDLLRNEPLLHEKYLELKKGSR
jgi:tetratricopeptide (TPR) repeat protein